MKFILFLGLFCSLGSLIKAENEKPTVTVGSKIFPESYILAEIIAQTLEHSGEVKVIRKFGLGGTGIVAEALKDGNIDLYPEYTGTISETILKNKSKELLDIRRDLKQLHFTISHSLGFNDTYALALNGKFAKENHLNTISDLKKVSDIRIGFSHEFMNRSDGYPSLIQAYGLKLQNVKVLEHSLAYEAIEKGEIDMTDAYSTDAKIQRFGLKVLVDDRHFFPDYYAVILARSDFVSRFPKLWQKLTKLEDSFTEDEIQRLNAMAELDKKSFEVIARDFFHQKSQPIEMSTVRKIWSNTKQHSVLVFVSMILAILVGLPLGVLGARFKRFGKTILLLSGVIQTIPSLALLCFLIPVFGIGQKPSLVALFLYGLLPIVINTYSGLIHIDKKLLESARALGLSYWERLFLIELPLASPAIMVGIQTSAIITIGTATLAALIGAGGYGTAIVTGLALNDNSIILQGAIPAALMALVVYGIFEVLNRLLIPKGLRI